MANSARWPPRALGRCRSATPRHTTADLLRGSAATDDAARSGILLAEPLLFAARAPPRPRPRGVVRGLVLDGGAPVCHADGRLAAWRPVPEGGERPRRRHRRRQAPAARRRDGRWVAAAGSAAVQALHSAHDGVQRGLRALVQLRDVADCLAVPGRVVGNARQRELELCRLVTHFGDDPCTAEHDLHALAELQALREGFAMLQELHDALPHLQKLLQDLAVREELLRNLGHLLLEL
mmetsp:Transcript_38521/g.123821  ORF Transcript_38521/g.123821 Transcript_38521/m.123821 type:complete len:236 (-) Transcript_38521:1754-2461(-)